MFSSFGIASSIGLTRTQEENRKEIRKKENRCRMDKILDQPGMDDARD
jgi:hypothetical protein